jgi:hypothetical protein
LEDRLANWGAWQRWRAEAHTSESKEGEYRRNPHWWEDGAPPTRGDPIDRLDAIDMESAVCLLGVYQAVLRAKYIWRAGLPRMIEVVKALGFREAQSGDVEAALNMARVMVEQNLLQPAGMRRDRAKAFAERLLLRVLGEEE